MTKINFKDLPSEETPINAENLNKLQSNIETEINKSSAKVFAVGNVTLTHASPTVLQTSTTVSGLSNVPGNKRAIMLTCQYVPGTPVESVNNLSYNTSGNTLVISANGNFQDGHVLSVDYVVLQKY